MKGIENKGNILQDKYYYAKNFKWKIIKNQVDDGFFFIESKLGD